MAQGSSQLRTSRLRRRRLGARRGVATVELAVCLPMLILFVIGSIECCNMIFLKHSLTTASYEGARAGIRYDATNAAVETRCQEIFTSHRVASAEIVIEPPDVAQVARGQQISVTVSAPSEPNSILPPWFFGGMTVMSSCTMVKE